jgi:hypothetical protein
MSEALDQQIVELRWEVLRLSQEKHKTNFKAELENNVALNLETKRQRLRDALQGRRVANLYNI